MAVTNVYTQKVRQGFANYAREWWHYGLRGAQGAAQYDIPITR